MNPKDTPAAAAADDKGEDRKAPANPTPDARVARVRTLVSGVKLKGFTLGNRKVVEGVSLELAKHREANGEVEILDIR